MRHTLSKNNENIDRSIQMEARAVMMTLPGELANMIIRSVVNVFDATTEQLKNRLAVKSIDKISQFNFAYHDPNRADCDALIAEVGAFIKAYQDAFELESSPMKVSEVSLKQELSSIMADPGFVSIMENLNKFVTNTNAYFKALANKLALEDRQKKQVPIIEVITKINEIVIEAKKRTDEKHADNQRLFDVEHLYDRCNRICLRCQNQSPQQIMVELCEVIRQCIEGIQVTTFGVQSTTVIKLEEVLKEAKQHTVKGGSPAISHQGASPQQMIAEIKNFFDVQLGNVGAAWESCSGISRIIPILNNETKSVAKKFEEIQAIAVERLNARTMFGYPVNRDPKLAKFYHGIKLANVERLEKIRLSLQEKNATSALRMSQ